MSCESKSQNDNEYDEYDHNNINQHSVELETVSNQDESDSTGEENSNGTESND